MKHQKTKFKETIQKMSKLIVDEYFHYKEDVLTEATVKLRTILFYYYHACHGRNWRDKISRVNRLIKLEEVEK